MTDKVVKIKNTEVLYADLPPKNLDSWVRFAEGIYIRHPFFSRAFVLEYDDVPLLDVVRGFMERESLDQGHPTATFYAENGVVISAGANGSRYHETHECERERRGIPTGQGYELCEGCHPRNHSEVKAIERARKDGKYAELRGATAYLYGHWWSCEPCSQAMEEAGITKVVFSKEWTESFLEIN